MNFNLYERYDMPSWNMAIGDGNTNRKRKRKLENNSLNLLNKNLVERVKYEVLKNNKKKKKDLKKYLK